MEQWRDVIGYEGYYEVSNLGRVWSVDRVVPVSGQKPRRLRGKVLAPLVNLKGYLDVKLSREGVEIQYRIHGLVASAWLGLNPWNLDVCHRSTVRTDNSVDNLYLLWDAK